MTRVFTFYSCHFILLAFFFLESYHAAAFINGILNIDHTIIFSTDCDLICKI